MEEFKVRRAAPADAERVSEMLDALGGTGWDAEGLRDAISRGDPLIMLAETQAGDLVGLGFLHVHAEPDEGEGPVAEVRQVLVLDDWWGMGVGAAILEGSRVVAVERGCREFRVLTR